MCTCAPLAGREVKQDLKSSINRASDSVNRGIDNAADKERFSTARPTYDRTQDAQSNVGRDISQAGE